MASPTHTIGVRPVAAARATFAATRASVSPWSRRRSAWPTSTYVQPRSTSIRADTSPVWAPPSASWTSWAPQATRVPASRSARHPDGGERGQDEQVATVDPGEERRQRARGSASVSLGVRCILRLVPTSGRIATAMARRAGRPTPGTGRRLEDDGARRGTRIGRAEALVAEPARPPDARDHVRGRRRAVPRRPGGGVQRGRQARAVHLGRPQGLDRGSQRVDHGLVARPGTAEALDPGLDGFGGRAGLGDGRRVRLPGAPGQPR